VLDRTNGRERKETNTGHCFAAIDIERFRPALVRQCNEIAAGLSVKPLA
jgi:hypothetical protein